MRAAVFVDVADRTAVPVLGLVKVDGVAAADVDDGIGTGLRDGEVTIDDLLYFLGRYGSGC